MKGLEVAGNGHRHHLMQQQQQQQVENKQSQSLPVSNNNHYPFQSDGPGRRFPDVGSVPGNRFGIPPTSPYSQFPSPAATRSPPPPSSAGAGQPYAGLMSQPPFFSLDVLAPFNPSPSPVHHANSCSITFVPNSASADASMNDHGATSSRSRSRSPPPTSKNAGCGLPPRESHRHSQSDIPFALFQSSPQVAAAAAPPQQKQPGGSVFSSSAKPPTPGGRSWARVVDGGNAVAGDDLFNAYMNLDGFGALNSEYNREELDRGSKSNGGDSSESEADSKANGAPLGLWANQNFLLKTMEGSKNSIASDLVQLSNPAARHCRSLSTDNFLGKLNFADESPKLLPSPGLPSGQSSKGTSNGCGVNSFSLEFGNGEFTPAEMKKIMENEKLVQMAISDPKRVKRILSNRQSAARSKERKTRYIVELEYKVKALQTETTTLSAQVTLLQREALGLANQNNELKFRLQTMEQQAQLRDALNESLTAEVRRMKRAVGGIADSNTSNNLNEQAQSNRQMFQMQCSSQSPSAQVAEPTK